MSLDRDSTGRRVVWTGRHPEASDGGLDGWNTSLAGLAERLDAADELVVLDPLSFPWEELTGAQRMVPMVLRLPEDLAVDEIRVRFGAPVLRHLTPHDRVVETRADVRAALTEDHDLVPEVWLGSVEDASDADPASRARAKAVFHQVAGLVGAEVATFVGSRRDDPIVGAVGRAHQLRGFVTRTAEVPVVAYPTTPDAALGPRPAPHLLIAWLEDGGQTAAERDALLRAALGQLHPGGRLLLLGYVVTAPGGGDNPSISQLVEELHDASGTLVHVDELRSVQLGSELVTRGVLLRIASLDVRRS